MILNGVALRAAQTAYRAVMSEASAKVTPVYEEFSQLVASSGYAENYLQSAGIGALHEWTGERQIGNVKLFDQTLTNRDWEKTLGIPRNAFLDDNLAVFRSQFAELGVMAKLHPDKLFGELLVNGFSSNSWDGVPYFATNHPIDGDVQSNLVTGALSAAKFQEAMVALRSMKSWGGEPLDVLGMGGQPVLLVGPTLEDTARTIVVSEYGDAGASNPNHKRAELVVFNRLTGNQWFLGVRGAPLRPFIFQERQKPNLVVKGAPDDANVFHDKTVLFGIDGRWEMGYAYYHFMVGSEGA